MYQFVFMLTLSPLQVAQSQLRVAEERELEEVYRSVTKLEDAHKKMSSQFHINRGFESEETN